MVLDKNSEVKLWDLVNKAGFATVAGVLAHGDDEGDGVFAWVHSRYDNGRTRVSTQFLIDNNSLLPDYQSDEAYAQACKSYGGINNVFLQPDGTAASSGTGSDGGSSGSSSGGGGTGSDGGSSGSSSGGSGNQGRSDSEVPDGEDLPGNE